MDSHNLNNASLHYTIIKFIIEQSFAPEIDELAEIFKTSENSVFDALLELQGEHGVVLHPDSPKIWVAHPFSLAPTNFLVYDDEREWWGNCAWCSLGIAALLDRDATITTTLGANDRQVDVHIRHGQVVETDLLVHFPIPMRHAWDNVIYTCSAMLLFANEGQIDRWCGKHRIAKGDVQPIAKVWDFAKVWYGNRLNPDWKKWTVAEAKSIFERFELTGDIWNIPALDARF